ncbi:MAG: NAD(P)-dependent oxidoreductase [Bacteroidaceae bacterium]|nr:NAD(P)-dependent oxidoreductase [Bacteroidaceae bacterium]
MNVSNLQTMLVTGASGFIGSFIVQEALERGFEVWAGVRGTSSRAYLTDERIHFAELDLSDEEKLREQLLTYKMELGGKGWDFVVHAAGATKCLHAQDFYRTNTDGTHNLICALRREGMIPRRFVFLSSLSIFGAIREKPVRKPSGDNPWIYAPIRLTDTPQPNTEYGRSKLMAEDFLMQQHGFPYTILRPTGVYGPHEKDYFLMAKSIAQHIDFAVGKRPQEITFVYVMDVVQAVFRSMVSPDAEGKAYFLSDGAVYSSRTFSDLLQEAMGVRRVFHITAPLWLLQVICTVSGWISSMTGKMNALNTDKYHILSQRNWQCDIEPARQDFGYDPQWQLPRGVEATVEWYKEEGWLTLRDKPVADISDDSSADDNDASAAENSDAVSADDFDVPKEDLRDE